MGKPTFSPKSTLELIVKALAAQPAYLLVFGICFVFLVYGGIATSIGLAKDNTIALVSGLLAFIAALITTIIAIRSVENKTPIGTGDADEISRLKEQIKQYESASKDIGELVTEHFIHKIGSLSITHRLIDLEGRTKSEWKWDEIQIIRQGARLPVLSHDMWFSSGATITRGPECSGENRSLSMDIYERKSNSWKCQMIIPGALQYGESLSYSLSAEIDKGFLVTKEEVEKSTEEFKREYWAFCVVSLMEKLELEVSFPEGYSVKCNVGVSLGPIIRSEVSMDGEELSRIRGNKWFVTSNGSARLTVMKPLIGFSYLIYWIPPAEKIVAELRTAV